MAAVEIPNYLVDRRALQDVAQGGAGEAESVRRLTEAGFLRPDGALSEKGLQALPGVERWRTTSPFTGKPR